MTPISQRRRKTGIPKPNRTIVKMISEKLDMEKKGNRVGKPPKRVTPNYSSVILKPRPASCLKMASSTSSLRRSRDERVSELKDGREIKKSLKSITSTIPRGTKKRIWKRKASKSFLNPHENSPTDEELQMMTSQVWESEKKIFHNSAGQRLESFNECQKLKVPF